jgi:hypothetical protein
VLAGNAAASTVGDLELIAAGKEPGRAGVLRW